ncbi:MAG: hypothetical protein CFH40_02242, partial [Alphaproteobacteria bacterium MarineAlpha10_Bin3]
AVVVDQPRFLDGARAYLARHDSCGDAVFDAGWNEKALGDAIAVTARMCFMQRLVEGHGFTQMPRDKARQNARKRVDLGYVDLYPEFADRSQDGK